MTDQVQAFPESWSISRLRLSAFQSGDFDLKTLWEKVSEEPARSYFEKPEEGKAVCSTAIGSTTCNLESGIGRVDLLWDERFFPFENPQAHFPKFECESEHMKSFETMSGKLLDNLAGDPAVSRLAFGTILLAPVSSRKDGYELLNGALPVEIDTINSREFMYQINRPTESTCSPGLSLNRISKWSVQTLTISEVQGSSTRVQKQHYQCRLELDFSTDVQYEGELGIRNFQELIKLSYEVSKYGDC